MKDFGWNVMKVKQGISDDEVLRIAEEAGYVLVTEDGVLAKRCRLKRVKVVELGVEEQASLIDQILRRDFKT